MRECFAFIDQHSKTYFYFPSIREIAEEMGFTTVWVTKVLTVLTREGYIEKVDRGIYRIAGIK